MQVEIEETFRSLTEWSAYAAQNPHIFDPNLALQMARTIAATGFVEPLTGQIANPHTTDLSNQHWREAIGFNGKNSRIRAVMHELERSNIMAPDVNIYAPEAVTKLAHLLRYLSCRFVGSEYLATEDQRRFMWPIRHEDLMNLSFPNESFDFVVTTDVLEHVPSLDQALREMVRILRPGGKHIGTVPFDYKSAISFRRADFVDGRIVHLLEPEYHGNPVDPNGSLVFEEPAWNLIDRAREAGFSDAYMRFVASSRYGYLSNRVIGIFLFCAVK